MAPGPLMVMVLDRWIKTYNDFLISVPEPQVDFPTSRESERLNGIEPNDEAFEGTPEA